MHEMDEAGRISPERAQDFVQKRKEGLPINVDLCAREPIHIPGAIQPHGVLVAFEPETRRIVACSGNVARHLSTTPEALLGRDAREALSRCLVDLALEKWVAGKLSRYNPLYLALPLADGAPEPVVTWVHTSDGLIVVEAETVPAVPVGDRTATHGVVNHAIRVLQETGTVGDLARAAVRLLRDLTGFERVLIYRFDRDWHGETIAEDKADDWRQSFLGLRSPASDIPAQARILYANNLIRFVPDWDYVPVPLLSTADRQASPLDLSGARLRSQSAAHREYQRNIGVTGSMSASIMKDGTLWGLVIGHHRGPHHVPPDVAESILTLTHVFGMRLYQIETEQAQAERHHQGHVCSLLIGQAAVQRDLAGALTKGETTIAGLLNVPSAALIIDGAVHVVGDPLPHEDITVLVDWIRDRASGGAIFAADDVPHRHPPFQRHARTASGVLAAFLGEGRRDVLLWFRRQEAETAAWAGDPAKLSVTDEGGTTILPRKNFERWLEIRAGYSTPWQDWEEEVADRLRRGIEDVLRLREEAHWEAEERIESIRRAEALERLRTARDEAERANLAKTRFLAAASHDLRQPVQSLLMFLELLQHHVHGAEGRVTMRNLGRGLDALKELLDNLLDVSQLDAGTVRPAVEDFLATEIIDQVAADFGPVAAAKGLEFRVSPCLYAVRSDRALLRRMINNIVENALRYTEAGRVGIECSQEGSRLRIDVEDTGIGVPPEHMERIWEEFHQVGNQERDRTNGLGLGLSIVQRLSELLSHPVRVRSVVGRGSVFSIEVPLGRVKPVKGPPEEPKTAGGGRFAVLVEDDSMVLLAIHGLFRAWGYEVLAAQSADEALQGLQKAGRAPDILVVDYRLRAGRVGTEAIRAIRKIHGVQVPALLLTGEIGEEIRNEAVILGVSLIQKPVTPRQLGRMVDQLLVQRR